MEKFPKKRKDNWGQSPAPIGFIGDSVTQGCFEIYKTPETSLKTMMK